MASITPTITSVEPENWETVLRFNRDVQKHLKKLTSSAIAGIDSEDIADWDTAFGWGDHDGLYEPVGSASTAVAGHESTYDHTQLHAPVTIPASPNGLSLTGQEISLPVTASPQFNGMTSTGDIELKAGQKLFFDGD